MLHIDATNDVVTIEPLDPSYSDGLLAIFATAGSNLYSESVERRDEASSEWHSIPPSAGARGTGNIVLRERHIYEPGEYRLTSSTRQGRMIRIFCLLIESVGIQRLKVQVLPASDTATWIMGNYDPLKIEKSLVTIHIDNGQIASVEAGEGQTQRRPTAWEQLGEDGL